MKHSLSNTHCILPQIIISVANLNSCLEKILTHAEIKELDTFVQSLLNDLDGKVLVLQSLSPPDLITENSQGIDMNKRCSVIKYSTAQDDGDPDS